MKHVELYDGDGVCLDFELPWAPSDNVEGVTCRACLQVLVKLGEAARERLRQIEAAR